MSWVALLLVLGYLLGCEGALHSNNTEFECANGEMRLDDANCEACVCEDNEWVCRSNGCNLDACQEGDERMAEDGCNECICQDAKWYCTTSECIAECEVGEEMTSECETCNCNSGEWYCENTCTNVDCIEGATRNDEITCESCRCINGEWACEATDCESPQMCADGEERLAGDGCNRCRCIEGEWSCTERNCGRERCTDGDRRMGLDGCNECQCEQGEWICTQEECIAPMCEDGAQQIAEDGCNLCVCQAGVWICSERSCEDQVCMEGEVYSIDSGCSQCHCRDNRWQCDEHCRPLENDDCTEDDEFATESGQVCTCDENRRLSCLCPLEHPQGTNCHCSPDGRWQCQQLPTDMECVMDDDCNAGRCIAKLCPPNDNNQCLSMEQRRCLRALDDICICTSGACVFAAQTSVDECIEMTN